MPQIQDLRSNQPTSNQIMGNAIANAGQVFAQGMQDDQRMKMAQQEQADQEAYRQQMLKLQRQKMEQEKEKSAQNFIMQATKLGPKVGRQTVAKLGPMRFGEEWNAKYNPMLEDAYKIQTQNELNETMKTRRKDALGRVKGFVDNINTNFPDNNEQKSLDVVKKRFGAFAYNQAREMYPDGDTDKIKRGMGEMYEELVNLGVITKDDIPKDGELTQLAGSYKRAYEDSPQSISTALKPQPQMDAKFAPDWSAVGQSSLKNGLGAGMKKPSNPVADGLVDLETGKIHPRSPKNNLGSNEEIASSGLANMPGMQTMTSPRVKGGNPSPAFQKAVQQLQSGASPDQLDGSNLSEQEIQALYQWYNQGN